MMQSATPAKTARAEYFGAAAATVLLAAAAIAAGASPVRAEQPTSVTSAGAGEIELTAEEKAEKDARKSCKVAICAGFRNPAAAPSDITCNVPKSWRKAQLDKMVSKAKVSWPWGPVTCNATIKLDRDALAKATTDEKSELKLATQSVDCRIANEGAEATKVSVEFAPTVAFEKGKAVKAQINWGNLEGPTLVKGLMWTATGTDNTLNVLQSTLVTDINDFIGKKCDEVKDDWSK